MRTAILMINAILAHLLMTNCMNESGEVESGKEENKVKDDKPIIQFTAEQQKAVDHIVQERLLRERAKYSDYEDLRKFRSEVEKQNDAKAQEELERQKKYEESKKIYETKLNEFSGTLSKKDQEIRDLKITHALTNEVSRQNGFIEETTALLKQNIMMDNDGNIIVKSKDQNGIDVNLSIADGVKKFLEQRPHLIRSTHKNGGGSGPSDHAGAGAGSSGSETNDLGSLNSEFVKAVQRGDQTKAKELKLKIRQAMTARGVSV